MTTHSFKRRVLVAEPHPVMREGLRAVLEQDGGMEVVAEVSTGHATIEAFTTFRPDVVLIDVKIQDLGLLETVIALRRVSVDGVVVLMCTYPRELTARHALAAGATSSFLKTATGDEIIDVIERAISTVGSSRP